MREFPSTSSHGEWVATAACAVLCAASLVTRTAAAQPVDPVPDPAPSELTTRAYGPSGNGETRSIIVSAWTDEGCVDPANWALSADGAQVEAGEILGPCTRWLTLRASGPSVTVRLRVAAGDAIGTTDVDMAPAPIPIRARREGDHVWVQVDDDGLRAGTTVRAYWADGSSALTLGPDTEYTGEVPLSALVGIVAHHGERNGVALLPGTAGQSAVLAPSALSVPTSGPSRTAFFVFATNRRNQPTRGVPLNLQAEGGQLSGLTWRENGIAAVTLSAMPNAGAVSVRLHASGETAVQTLQIPTFDGWPTSVTLETGAQPWVGGTLDVRVAAVRTGGVELPLDAVVLRCGAEEVSASLSGVARCPVQSMVTTILAGVLVDDTWIALGSVQVQAREPDPSPLVEQPVVQPEERTVLAEEHEPPLAVASPPRAAYEVVVGTYGAIDQWVRPFVGVGAGARVAINGYRVGARARYAVAWDSARTEPPVEPGRAWLRFHTLDAFLTAGYWGNVTRGVALVAELRAGPSVVVTRSQLGGDTADEVDVRWAFELAAGPTLEVGAFALDLHALVRGTWIRSDPTWREARVRFGLELSVAYP